MDSLDPHAELEAMPAENGRKWGGPGGKVVTTFRPDNLVEPDWPGWAERVERLGEITGNDTSTFDGFLTALRARRQDFIAAGATCSDHGNLTARTEDDPKAAAEIFAKALNAETDEIENLRFPMLMLTEFARMSVDDGLVMQLHPGSWRNHNKWLHEGWGRDVGGDIPNHTMYTGGLKPLLDAFGNDPRFRMVVYTLDETSFSREIAPSPAATPPSSPAPLVVPRLARGHDALPRGDPRDRRVLQHRRIRRRHARVLLHPGPPRPGPPHRRRVPRPPGRRAPHDRGRGRSSGGGPGL
ncbi:hypothetical protein GCM10029992_61020 [Glycomyces albus]